MPATTPPKGRPTTGRRDRQVAQHRSQSRSTTKKFVWGVLALALLIAVLVLGTGTGSPPDSTGTTASMVPLLLLRRLRPEVLPAPRS